MLAHEVHAELCTVFLPRSLIFLLQVRFACLENLSAQHRFQVQGTCVVLDARRLVGHSRTNVLDHLLVLAFWVPGKMSDCSPRTLFASA